MPYNVKLDIFEGPLDLLLHLIRKHEVDIYDIPISSITDQYLEYIDMMKTMNLELAGEFILMAATLIHIKSKTLLPLPEEPNEEEEGEDPRSELMRKLLEYQRYKQVAEELADRDMLGRDVFARGIPPTLFADGLFEKEEGAGFSDVSIFALMEAFREVIKKLPKAYEIDLTVDRFQVADKINFIMDVLGSSGTTAFKELFPPEAQKGEVVVTFLALLELAKMLMIKLYQTDDGAIRLYRAAGAPETTESTSNEVH